MCVIVETVLVNELEMSGLVFNFLESHSDAV